MQILDDIRSMRQALATLSSDAAPGVRSEREAELSNLELEANVYLVNLQTARRETWEFGNMAADEKSRRMARQKLTDVEAKIAEIEEVLKTPTMQTGKIKALAPAARATTTASTVAKQDTGAALTAMSNKIYARREQRNQPIDKAESSQAATRTTGGKITMADIARKVYGNQAEG